MWYEHTGAVVEAERIEDERHSKGQTSRFPLAIAIEPRHSWMTEVWTSRRVLSPPTVANRFGL